MSDAKLTSGDALARYLSGGEEEKNEDGNNFHFQLLRSDQLLAMKKNLMLSANVLNYFELNTID